jgi:hypothetical protein
VDASVAGNGVMEVTANPDAQTPTAAVSTPLERPAETEGQDHGSLKYSLLGPSLTKAGQDAVDQKKVLSASQ